MRDHFGGQEPAPVIFPLAVTWRRLVVIAALLLSVVIAVNIGGFFSVTIIVIAGVSFGYYVGWLLGVRTTEIYRAEQAGEKSRVADLKSVKW